VVVCVTVASPQAAMANKNRKSARMKILLVGAPQSNRCATAKYTRIRRASEGNPDI
jgi:hypothetical protein